MSEDKNTWLSILATFLWVFASVGAFTLLIPVDTIFSVIGIAIQSGEATESVTDKYRLVTTRQFGAIIFGAAWLGMSIWGNNYLEKSKTVGQLFKRFGLAMGVEVAIWLIAYIANPAILTSMLPW